AAKFWDFYANGLRNPGMPRRAVLSDWRPQTEQPSFDPFEREALNERKRAALLRAASAFFNRGGFDGTSLDEIVASLGLTKGAFYYYIEN
ncbi:helix-turn-helix domain-containing protein, partial [Acinetobacter baumannii]